MALAYTAPTWENGGGVGISASQLQALSDCMEGLVQGSDKAITNIAISGQTITLTFADGSEETGTASGLKGISSIAKTGTSGNVDTYTITYTDGSTSTFTVTNGADGSFYIVTAGIKSTDDPYGNIEYYIGGDFYKNGVLYNQSAFYKVTLVDETEYPPSPYLIDDSSGTFTNGHYSTGSIGGIPSGATITTQIFTDSTMATLLGEVKVLIGLRGSEGEQGPQGPAGDDGVSPEVTITTITGGHRVTITDADHPSGQNFDVMDGHDGASDWADITNKPNFATVATSGSYNDLSNKPTIPDEVTANPTGTATGTLTKLGIGSDIYGIQGGGGGIDGSTVTPTDVIATWLACAGLHQSYTTLNEVLVDSAVLSALMESTNAVDYLVRSTTWASAICADELAMNYIGENNYCADVLLSDSTWRTAICNSTYFEQVLNAKVPQMTGYTTPSGEVIYSSYFGSCYAYYVFNGYDSYGGGYWSPTRTAAGTTGSYVGYHFPYDVCINALVFTNDESLKNYNPKDCKVQYSSDGTNWVDIASITILKQGGSQKFVFANTIKASYIRLLINTYYYNHEIDFCELQFYGRSDLPPVDDRLDEKADKTDIAPRELGTASSRAYVVGQQFYLSDGKLYKCKQPIAQGATFTIGTNCELADCITDQIKEDLLLSVDNLSVNYNTNYDTGISVSNCFKYKQIRIVTRHSGASMINSIVVPIVPSLNYIGSTYNTCYFNGTNHMMLVCARTNTNLYIQLNTNFSAASYKITGIDVYGIK